MFHDGAYLSEDRSAILSYLIMTPTLLACRMVAVCLRFRSTCGSETEDRRTYDAATQMLCRSIQLAV